MQQLIGPSWNGQQSAVLFFGIRLLFLQLLNFARAYLYYSHVCLIDDMLFNLRIIAQK